MGKTKGNGADAAPAGKPVPTFYVSPHYAADDKAVVKLPKALCTCWRNICEKKLETCEVCCYSPRNASRHVSALGGRIAAGSRRYGRPRASARRAAQISALVDLVVLVFVV